MKRNEAAIMNLVRSGLLGIDDQGRIWRNKIVNNAGPYNIEPRRAESPMGSGYLEVRSNIKGKRYRCSAARLVWQFFNGDIPPRMYVTQINRVRTDNRPENLTLLTLSQRNSRKVRLGNVPRRTTKRVQPPKCNRCEIPYRAQPVQSKPGYFEGDMFCIVCPDADWIPLSCTGCCVPSQGGKDGSTSCCPEERRDGCPCAVPATPERRKAYIKWALARGRRLAVHTRDRRRKEHWKNPQFIKMESLRHALHSESKRPNERTPHD